MRLKTFHAQSMTDVMDQVREELGPDAIIVSIEQGKKVGGVRVTAAIEAGATPPAPDHAPEPSPTPLFIDDHDPIPKSQEYDQGEITAVLNHHSVPFDTGARIEEAIRSINAASLVEAFAAGLETTVRFSPLTDRTTRPIMLIGPAGAGKTICAAKLAADALMHSRKVSIISTDVNRAGGVRQLEHFASLMKQSVLTAESATELKDVIEKCKQVNEGHGLTVIDTQSVNPFNMEDLELLLGFIQAVDAEPIAVLPAGIDPYDAREISEIFSRLGAQRFIATRLDAARRYGSIITSARPGSLALAAISRSPYVADGIEPATPYALARLLVSLPGLNKSNNADKKRKSQ